MPRISSYYLHLTYAVALLFILVFCQVFCAIQYPVTIGGYTGDTVLQLFTIDSSGNLAIGGLCSDMEIVTSPNTNIVMYQPAAQTTWLWTKQLTTLINQKLLDLNFRSTDSLRMVALYESSLLIIFSTSDGSIVKSAQGINIKCNLGCTTRYDSNVLYLFGTYNSGSDYLGIYSFDPDNQSPPSSIFAFSDPTYVFYFPLVDRTDNSRFVIAAESSPSYSMYLGMPTSLANGLDSTNPNYESYFYYSSSSTTQIDFLALEPYSLNKFYLLVYFVSTNQVVLFDAFMAYSPSHYFTASVLLVTTTTSLSLPNGVIFPSSGPRLYIGGNNMQQLLSQTSSNPKIAFIYSFQQSESLLSIQASSILQVQPTTTNTLSYFTTQSTNTPFSTITDTQVTSTITTSNMMHSSLPTEGGPIFSCSQLNIISSYPQNKNYFIPENLIATIVPIPVAPCTTLSCTYILTLEVAAADITYTYNQGLNQYSLSITNTARDGLTILLDMVQYLPPDQIGGCPQYYQALQINIYDPKILTSTIPTIIYNVGQGSLNVPAFTAFTNDKGITGDSKLDIQYQLQYQDGSTYVGGPITSFNPTTRVISVLSSDFSLPRSNSMKIIANFAYNPSYTVTQVFSLIIEKCYNSTISTFPLITLIYQVNEPQITTNAGPWSNTFPSECGPITYTASPTLPITFNPIVPSFSTFTNLISHDGYYSTPLTGYLYDNLLNQQYKSATVNFNVIIFDPSITKITPTIIDSQTYTIKDPLIKVILPSFTSNKAYLQPIYQLKKLDGSSFDQKLFTFNQNTLELIIYSEDPSQIGVHELTLQAKFSANTPYSVQSSFTVTILHYCLRNVIKASHINQENYYIADPQLAIPVQPWSFNMSKDCQPETYIAKLDDGSNLPGFIKFDKQKLIFNIFTPLIQDMKQYSIVLKGTTKYYDIARSTTQKNFILNVQCEVRTIFSTQKSRSFKFQLGSILPLTITYEDFTISPKCPGPQNTPTYSIKIGQSDQIPSYITFDSSQNTLRITDDGSLKVGIQTIFITGSVGSNVKTTIRINLNIVAQQILEESKGIELEAAQVSVQADLNSPTIWTIKDFKAYTLTPCKMINIDQNATFVQLLSQTQQLSIQPTSFNLGMNQVILISTTDKKDPKTGLKEKISQKVNILVTPKGQSSLLKIDAIISEISKGGLVTIDFNQKMIVPTNISFELSELDLQVLINNKDGLIDTKIIFKWSPVQFYQNQPPGSKSVKGYEGSRLNLYGLLMNRLWGMIKSIQIILMFPLTLVDIPANAQLIYFFMTYNCNMQLFPSDSFFFLLLNFGSINEADEIPFNDKFDDQDIF